jgi:hypothetical protein
MKNRKLLYIALVLSGSTLFGSCSKNFIDVKPKGNSIDEANYYKTPDQAFAALISVYDPISNDLAINYSSMVAILGCASDDCFAGGGSSSDVPTWQSWNNYHLDAANGPQADIWQSSYKGIYRANVFLTHSPEMTFLPDDLHKRYDAEVKFLRAYYYFDLVRLFKNIPLFTAALTLDNAFQQPQANPADVYKQIEADLTAAIADLPATVPVATDGGRATQGAAKALLARVILFQNDNTRMSTVATLLEDVNKDGNAYGYKLLADFGSVFAVNNKFNSESVFEIVHTSAANNAWADWPNVQGNVGVQMFGARSYVGDTYEAGWGFCPVTTQLATFMAGDPRFKYTIVNMDSLKLHDSITYDPSYQNTGFFMAKFAPLKANKSTGGGNFELNWPNDVIAIRLSDCYLMEAEALVRGGGDLTKASSYLNAVRARVGLAPVDATLDNIYKERRMELATEGQRYFDLIRTGQAATALSFKGFAAGKNELLPIPLNELTNTQLKQNPGY